MMMSIAKVESDFNPRARTGSYKGLFQLSDYEFKNTVTAASGPLGTTLVQQPHVSGSSREVQMGAWSLSRLRRKIHGASAGYPRRD